MRIGKSRKKCCLHKISFRRGAPTILQRRLRNPEESPEPVLLHARLQCLRVAFGLRAFFWLPESLPDGVIGIDAKGGFLRLVRLRSGCASWIGPPSRRPTSPASPASKEKQGVRGDARLGRRISKFGAPTSPRCATPVGCASAEADFFAPRAGSGPIFDLANFDLVPCISSGYPFPPE